MPEGQPLQAARTRRNADSPPPESCSRPEESSSDRSPKQSPATVFLPPPLRDSGLLQRWFRGGHDLRPRHPCAGYRDPRMSPCALQLLPPLGPWRTFRASQTEDLMSRVDQLSDDCGTDETCCVCNEYSHIKTPLLVHRSS